MEPLSSDGATAGAAEVTNVRPEVVDRFRTQVAAGAYEPSVEKLVDRLMSLILAAPAEGRPGREV